MTKRIFRSIFLVAVAVLLACLILIMGVLYEYFNTMQRNTLAAQMTLAAQGVQNEGLSYLNGLEESTYRLTWIQADGTVLYDSRADETAMENHADREEIQEALSTGVGESERTSATLAEKTLYRAVRLSDGSVLRIGVTQYTVVTLLLGMLQPIAIVLLAAIVLSVILAKRVSKQITEPLNALDLDRPLENETYEELSPVLTRIERQHRQINSQLEQLRQKQDEFAAITGSMSEGLVLLDDKNTILSINPAAARLFGTDAACIGQNMLTVDRSLAMQKLIADAQAGTRGEAVVALAGGTYQIDASPVTSNDKRIGVCILAFDVTEKAQAEQMRREFSANVSHELKTPLQSIMGSAELIENGLVKQEDLPRFVGHIRSEAGRLVTLIDDIIRLSQLDEGGELPVESVNLTALAGEAADALSGAAGAKNVTITVEGAPAEMQGVRRLLYEIVYNLCDNAIKYNVDGGSVKVSVSKESDGVLLSVADTGIGIPSEAQSRVFERFYRVDKSHSKESGGTGLGLSIVKHAAQQHHADIHLESAPGKGTTIQIHFPNT
ncbi:MAG: ATP-binding protein [Oscillospiraceae bacterium]